jgi:hypothetical protein
LTGKLPKIAFFEMDSVSNTAILSVIDSTLALRKQENNHSGERSVSRAGL